MYTITVPDLQRTTPVAIEYHVDTVACPFCCGTGRDMADMNGMLLMTWAECEFCDGAGKVQTLKYNSIDIPY